MNSQQPWLVMRRQTLMGTYPTTTPHRGDTEVTIPAGKKVVIGAARDTVDQFFDDVRAFIDAGFSPNLLLPVGGGGTGQQLYYRAETGSLVIPAEFFERGSGRNIPIEHPHDGRLRIHDEGGDTWITSLEQS